MTLYTLHSFHPPARLRRFDCVIPDLPILEGNLPMPDLAEFMTVQEAAQRLGFNVMSIRRLLRGEKLQGVKVGKTWLVSKESVREYHDKTAGMSKNDPRRND